MDRTQLALELAREVGFDLAGVAPLRPPAAAGRFERWLDEGRHGSMGWLERQRERIVDPARILPGARTLLVVGLAHARPPFELGDGTRVARYAAGKDYHNVATRLLGKLSRRLEAEGFAGPWRKIVDAGPLLERSHAAEAGLGFESKAANLLHPAFGPWFFLGELLLGEDLEPTPDAPIGSCGTCTACLDACPTGAIVAPGVVHAPDCISYLTIEHKGPIKDSLREQLGSWGFGCDVCSEVCPWARRAPDLSARFGVHPALADGSAISWLTAGPAFVERFQGSPLRRPGREGLARNAAIVLGGRPGDEGRATLLEALDFDPAPLVREAAAWALARGHGADAGVSGRLEAAAAREPDPTAAGAMSRHLEQRSGPQGV
jgi:epoxyqueuosine reductase